MKSNIKLRNIKLDLPLLLKRIDNYYFPNDLDLQKIASKVISLILLKSTIPTTIFHEDCLGRYLIKDNGFFIMAIQAFMNNDFTLSDAPFIEEFNELTFSELPNFQQNLILEHKLNIIVISPAETTETYSSFVLNYNLV